MPNMQVHASLYRETEEERRPSGAQDRRIRWYAPLQCFPVFCTHGPVLQKSSSIPSGCACNLQVSWCGTSCCRS